MHLLFCLFENKKEKKTRKIMEQNISLVDLKEIGAIISKDKKLKNPKIGNRESKFVKIR